MPSLLDNDLYKYTMGQAVLHHFPCAEVEYKFICRKEADLLPLKEKIERKIDLLCESKITQEELDYLRTIRFLKKDYINFLEDFTLKRRLVKVYEQDGKLQISVKGPWIQTIFFEVPLLAIVSETYCEGRIAAEYAYEEGRKNLQKKIDYLNRREEPFFLADFGTRRRFSKAWQDEVVGTLKKSFPKHFIGTSNLSLAMKHNVKPIGTMAHEWLQAGQGLNRVQLINSQKFMLEKWTEEYRGDLGIALTDTIGLNPFLKDFDSYLAKLYDGVRHDSGDPFTWGKAIVDHYKSLGIDPMTKTAIFSDNLNFEKASEIEEYFKNKIKVSFGIGTNLTNDVGINPLSIVIKLVSVNGNPVAKVSDEPQKVICENENFLTYLKNVFKL